MVASWVLNLHIFNGLNVFFILVGAYPKLKSPEGTAVLINGLPC